MSGFTVSGFTSDINGTSAAKGIGLSRANQFGVTFFDPTTIPLATTGTGTDSKFDHAGYDILVKSAQFPGSTIAALPVNYGGRVIKLSGFRTFDNWTVTIINDEDYRHRKWLEAWMYTIAGMPDGVRDNIGKGLYKNPATARVMAYNNQGGGTANWEFVNMWPTALGDITLDWSSDTVQEYTCEFAYEYWTQGHTAVSPPTSATDSTKIPIGTDVTSVIT